MRSRYTRPVTTLVDDVMFEAIEDASMKAGIGKSAYIRRLLIKALKVQTSRIVIHDHAEAGEIIDLSIPSDP